MGDEPVYSHRKDDINFDVFSENDKQTIYADGFSSVGFGPSVVRLDLFVVSGSRSEGDTVIEQRKSKSTLIVPTPAFIDFVVSVMPNVIGSEELLHNSITSTFKRMEAASNLLKKKET